MKVLVLLILSFFLFGSFFVVDYKEIPVEIYKEKSDFNNIQINDSIIYYFSEGFDSKVIVKFKDSVLLENEVLSNSNWANKSLVIHLDKMKYSDEIIVFIPSKGVKFTCVIDKMYKYVHLYLYPNFCINTHVNSKTISE